MSEWLTRATDALRGEKDPEPQPFELDCDCGTRHSGVRRRKYQRIICRSCGSALFVLPYNSYPPPLAPQPKKKRKRKRQKSSGDTAGGVMSAEAAVTAGRALASRAVTGVSEASAQVAARTTAAGRGLGHRVSASGKAVVRFWTPFRLVLLGMCVVIGATAFLTLHSRSDDAAITRLKQSEEAGREALGAGDVPAACEQFEVAVAALDQLGRQTDPLACDIRQLYRETKAMRDLLPSSVFKVVNEADEALDDGQLDEFDQQFRLRDRHRWIVLEGPVTRVGGSTEGGHYRIDVPAALGDHARTVVIAGRLPALDVLKFRDSRREVILAGQLRSCELSGDRLSWVLRLEPETAFLWSNVQNYTALGLMLDDPERVAAVHRILSTQSLANGLPR